MSSRSHAPYGRSLALFGRSPALFGRSTKRFEAEPRALSPKRLVERNRTIRRINRRRRRFPRTNRLPPPSLRITFEIGLWDRLQATHLMAGPNARAPSCRLRAGQPIKRDFRCQIIITNLYRIPTPTKIRITTRRSRSLINPLYAKR